LAYTPYHSTWHEADSVTGGGDTSTPVNAAALMYIEAGIVDAAADADAAGTLAAAAIPDPGGASSGNGLLWNGSDWVAAAITTSTAISAVTALPGSPADGDEVIFTDSLSAPTYSWHLRYNAGSGLSYKWEFIGGAPKMAFDESFVSPPNQYPTYTALEPHFTAPRSGDYLIAWGCQFAAEPGQYTQMGIMSATAASATTTSPIGAVGILGSPAPGGREYVWAGLTSGSQVWASYVYNLMTQANATVGYRWMRVIPLRVS